MNTITSIDWDLVADEMHGKGFAIIPKFIADSECEDLKAYYDTPDAYRKTVVMERYRFGLGEYKYFNYPLPGIIQQIRTNIYPHLAPIANVWFRALKIVRQFPPTHHELLQQC
jgi:hypothetical protein